VRAFTANVQDQARTALKSVPKRGSTKERTESGKALLRLQSEPMELPNAASSAIDSPANASFARAVRLRHWTWQPVEVPKCS
jgi:transposase-like protein